MLQSVEACLHSCGFSLWQCPPNVHYASYANRRGYKSGLSSAHWRWRSAPSLLSTKTHHLHLPLGNFDKISPPKNLSLLSTLKQSSPTRWSLLLLALLSTVSLWRSGVWVLNRLPSAAAREPVTQLGRWTFSLPNSCAPVKPHRSQLPMRSLRGSAIMPARPTSPGASAAVYTSTLESTPVLLACGHARPFALLNNPWEGFHPEGLGDGASTVPVIDVKRCE